VFFKKFFSKSKPSDSPDVQIVDRLLSIDEIGKYSPFDNLLPKYNIIAHNFATILQFAEGEVIAELHSDCEFDYFLMEGTVELISQDQRVRVIQANQPAAKKRLISLRPCCYQVVVGKGGATLFKIENAIVEQLNNIAAFRKTKPWEDELILGYAEKEHLFERIHRELIYENIVIPTLPEIADAIYQHCLNDEITVDELVDTISGDIANIAKIMKAANSLFFHGQSPVNNLHQAIERLGRTTTIALLKYYASEEVFFSHQEPERLFKANYLHALELAIIARYIAKTYHPEVDEELVYIAAMLSYIGKTSIYNYVMDYVNDDSELPKIETIAREYYVDIGKQILQAWNLCPTYVKAVENISNWTITENDSSIEQDILVCAHVHQAINHEMQDQIPPLQQVSALKRVFGEGYGPELSINILNQTNNELKQLSQI